MKATNRFEILLVHEVLKHQEAKVGLELGQGVGLDGEGFRGLLVLVEIHCSRLGNVSLKERDCRVICKGGSE